MTGIFERLGKVIGKRPLIILIACLVLIIPAVIGASHVEEEIGIETLVSTDTQEYKDYQRFTDSFSEDVILLLVTADSTEQLIQRDNMLAFEDFEEQMADQENVAAVIGPAYLVKYAMTQLTGTPSVPDDETILWIIRDPETGAIREQFGGLFPDQRHAMVSVVMEGGLELEDQFDVVDITEAVATNTRFKDATYVVTGSAVMGNDSVHKMRGALNLMILVAVIIMLVILALVFRVRNFFAWRWLPLSVVFVGIIYTFGIMGAIGVPLNHVTIATFPILIGLGVGFTIQFHDRYDKAMNRGEAPAKAVIEAITRIGPATGIAFIVVFLGFVALLTSPVPMIVDFGYALMIGAVVMYVLAVVLLLPVLYWNDHRKEWKRTVDGGASKPTIKGDGFVERGFRKLSPVILKHSVIIILLAIILCVSGFIIDSSIDAQPDVMKYMSDDWESVQNVLALQDLTGGWQHASILVEADNVTEPQVLGWILTVQETIEINEPESVGTVESFGDIVLQSNDGTVPRDPADTEQILSEFPRPFTLNLVNSDFTAANIALTLPGLNADDLRGLRNRLVEYTSDPPDGVTAAVTGSSIVQDKMSSGLTSGREKMTLIGIGLVFAGLFALFRFRLKRAIVAVLPTIFIIGWAAIIIYLLGIEYTPAGATRGALSMGIGVMFTILLMNRYYEECDSGQAPAEAITSAMVAVGRPVVACGLTIIGGFASLQMATDFPIVTDFGIITLLTIFFGLVSTLIVLPPMIVLADSRLTERAAQTASDHVIVG